MSENDRNRNWILLTRDGKPIPPERGNYEISKIVDEGNYLKITDSNTEENIEYVWIVDEATGVFISQTLITVETP